MHFFIKNDDFSSKMMLFQPFSARRRRAVVFLDTK
jgi:hypothetical protein